LLVVLHGNRGTAEQAADRWRDAALARAWGVLGLQCPEAEGCDDAGRWYRWRGDPRWVVDQVAAVEAEHAIDPARIYLAGWSGGATYIGMNLPAWPATFAAAVIHGGGQPPEGDACPPAELPVYFLVGDANPAHPAARRLRDHVRACGQPYVWDLVEGADHAAEDRALDLVRASAILDWLAARARTSK
jgi:poly(3-hydroxybutyrate) depolymerase